MVHLGLGNFYRAHQAWYSNRAADADEWGYAAFEGRGNSIAPVLQAQDNVYTLAFAYPDGDQYEVMECISKTHTGREFEAWIGYFTDPRVVIASTTITEAGYLIVNGTVDVANPQFAEDLNVLRAGGIEVISAPARLVAGLRARRAAGAGAMAVMSCDNLPHNGDVLRTVTIAAAELVDPSLAQWIAEHISFVTTMVDRITPKVTEEDVTRISTGVGARDASPIVAEPFGEWVISGAFPGGHPDWASAGATFAQDVAPHERRKLWLLNGAHSLLAYVGLQRGHTFVHEAMQDAVCVDVVSTWWQQVIPHLEGDATTLGAYAVELRKRFENPRVSYQLAQIGTDGSLKIPVRWVPGIRAIRATGAIPSAACKGLAAYVQYVNGADVRDARRDALLACADVDPQQSLRKLLQLIAPELLTDAVLLAAIDAEIVASTV